jgi:hypothetical protein
MKMANATVIVSRPHELHCGCELSCIMTIHALLSSDMHLRCQNWPPDTSARLCFFLLLYHVVSEARTSLTRLWCHLQDALLTPNHLDTLGKPP